MARALGGFLIGFFLAVFLLFAVVKVQFGPLEPELVAVEPHLQTVHEITHSQLYSDIIELAEWVDDVVGGIADIPFLNNAIPDEIPAASGAIPPLLVSAKAASESALPAVRSLLFLIRMSVPAMLISVLMMGLGAFMIWKDWPKLNSFSEQKRRG